MITNELNPSDFRPHPSDRSELFYLVYGLVKIGDDSPKMTLLGGFRHRFDARQFLRARREINPRGYFEILQIST